MSMLPQSNFPPGIRGDEPQIAGPDREYEAWRFCEACDNDTTHIIWRYGLTEALECRECGHESESEIGPDSI